MTAAARALGVAQSTVSEAVAELLRVLCTTLGDAAERRLPRRATRASV